MIRVETNAFDVGLEYETFKRQSAGAGAVVMFTGCVRDLSEGRHVASMQLEHYPGMTEKALRDIECEARARWPVDNVLIVHRFGTLSAGEDIVMVMTSSAHREAAFAACAFLMDWLKTKAPFWKLEVGDNGSHWVDAKSSDDTAADRWKI